MDKLGNYFHQCDEFKIITDVFLCGSQEKAPAGHEFSGAYPAGFLKRVKAAFSEYYPQYIGDILHVCSGRISSTEGMRLDISSEYNPDFLCNAEDMSGHVSDEKFYWVMSDTPYNEAASMKYYKLPMLTRSKVIKEMCRVCKVGGFVSMLDQISPNNTPRCLERVALIGVTSIPNQDMRIYSVFRKVSKYG